MEGLFKVRTPPPPYIPVQIPFFDYVVDIYSDRVVVTKADGTTIQLSTIADLNNWLGNITDKKIRINVNVEIYDNLMLTPNEYWFFGEWIHGSIHLFSGKYTIISFTRLGDAGYRGYVTTYNPQIRDYVDISGSKIYSVYADLDIHGKADMILRDIVICVEMAYESFIEYVDGDIYVRGGFVNIMRSTLLNAYIEADFISLEDVTSREYTGAWIMISRIWADIRGTVDASNTLVAILYFRNTVLKNIEALSSVTIDLPTINYYSIHYRIVFIGIRKGSNPYYHDPLPSNITCYFDEANRKIVINNTTENAYNIVLTYEITTVLPAYM